MSAEAAALARPKKTAVAKLELTAYAVALAVLGGALLGLGAQNSELRQRQPLAPKAVYALLANPQVRVQVIDTRPVDDDNYLDSHIPGAIPLPGCDDAKAPPGAAEHVYSYVTTVIVSAEGDAATFEQCRARFSMARNLQGGMTAWSEAKLPEDNGEYSPPKASAGGGCL